MAGFDEYQDEDEAVAQINVVPFVDIALVLLIIFLLTASLIAKAAIPVSLPHAANANDTVNATVHIVVNAEGELFLDGSPTTGDALGAAIKSGVAADPKLRAVISADKSLRYERVIEVMDLLKENDLSDFSLDVERTR